MPAEVILGVRCGAVAGHDDFNSLHLAAQLGHVEVADRLIAAGCDVNARTTRVRDHTACAPCCSVETLMLQALLRSGVSIPTSRQP